MNDKKEERIISLGTNKSLDLSPEEKQRLMKLGRQSGIEDDDLPIGFSPSLAAQFGQKQIQDMNDLLKGQIAEMAKRQGVSPLVLVERAKEVLMDQSPKNRLN